MIDEIDRMIIRALASDGKTTNRELAALTGLSTSRCSERVSQLERDGVIEGYHADVDPGHLGGNLQALVAIRLKHENRSTIEDFMEYATELPETLAVYYLTGANDFLVHVVANSPEGLSDLVLRRFTSKPEVASLETSLVYRYARRWIGVEPNSESAS